MAERKRPRRTRERIVETSLVMFNRLGEPNVTTADIADEMGISPGNLYYHFRNKDEIIGELFAALERRLDALLDPRVSGGVDVEDLWLFLHLLFEAMWDYRFLYRDLDEILSRSRKLATRFASNLLHLPASLFSSLSSGGKRFLWNRRKLLGGHNRFSKARRAHDGSWTS